METKPNDPIQSCTMKQVGENDYRPSKPNEKTDYQHQSTGLTKREHFAGLAMASYYGGEHIGQSGMPYEDIAANCVLMADALISALNK